MKLLLEISLLKYFCFVSKNYFRYQKFLYDYECDKEGLSTSADLQQAIDGNRREGRRSTSSTSSFPQIGYSVAHHNTTALLSKRMNGSLNLRAGMLTYRSSATANKMFMVKKKNAGVRSLVLRFKMHLSCACIFAVAIFKLK